MAIERQVQDLTERVAILEAALRTRASVAPHLAPTQHKTTSPVASPCPNVMNPSRSMASDRDTIASIDDAAP
ncbi:hypothetical protein N8342_01035, partial [Acidimicrobiales bacterium]|nr:hypothetical protein [Acidimicrobiales bacterium]